MAITHAFPAAAIALTVALGVPIAAASTFCPPGGPGAPTYCENIPHKGKLQPPGSQTAPTPPAAPAPAPAPAPSAPAR